MTNLELYRVLCALPVGQVSRLCESFEYWRYECINHLYASAVMPSSRPDGTPQGRGHISNESRIRGGLYPSIYSDSGWKRPWHPSATPEG